MHGTTCVPALTPVIEQFTALAVLLPLRRCAQDPAAATLIIKTAVTDGVGLLCVLGIATCDKGLPAMLLAVAGLRDLPGVVVPGGVTLPPTSGETKEPVTVPSPRSTWRTIRSVSIASCSARR